MNLKVLVLSVIILFYTCSSQKNNLVKPEKSEFLDPIMSPYIFTKNKKTTLKKSNKYKFVLYVSNQNFTIDPVDISVWIDSKKIIQQDFYVNDGHNWKKFVFILPKGIHTIIAKSKEGKARIEKQFELNQKLWGVIDYWYEPSYPKSRVFGSGTPKQFSFRLSKGPIYFM
ncbi:MAG: hypothetical protein OEV44_09925 [Spirochaetota bacterium]|nr:hypothetical protein [Spirochaetota bacterium]